MRSTSGVCVCLLLSGIKWYQFVRNDDAWRLTKQTKLTAIIQSRRLTLFGHIARMDDNADVSLPSGVLEKNNQDVPALRGSAPSNTTWDTTILRSRSSKFGLELPSVEDYVVEVWRYAILELYTRNDDNDELQWLQK